MALIPANRMELLKLKSNLKISKKGHALLEKKRDTLVAKLIEMVKDYKKVKKEAIEKLDEANRLLLTAEGVSGVNRVKGVSYSSDNSFDIVFSNDNVMGVKIPRYNIEFKKVDQNFSPLGLSDYVFGARFKFGEALPLMLRAYSMEESIYILADEIKKVKRRVNSLENVRIPNLNKSISDVRLMIEELERESFIRLKHAKKKII